MVKIKKNTISMTRGDTLRTKISIIDMDGNEYIPVEGDAIRFAMKKTYNSENLLIYKEIPNDTLELHLAPEDTKELAQPSDYVYDVQITFSTGDVLTFISGEFHIMEEVE